MVAIYQIAFLAEPSLVLRPLRFPDKIMPALPRPALGNTNSTIQHEMSKLKLTQF